MKALYETISKARPDPAKIEIAGRILREGGLVAFPTETVYGLGGNALDPEASAHIYAAKGRPSDNPLIVHIADMKDLPPLVKTIPESAQILADKFWPGPLTMILEKSSRVPLQTTGGLDTGAVRFPSDPIAQALIRAAGVPVAAPSANVSGRPSPTTAARVREDLGDTIDMILDGGPVGIGLESTIVDLTVIPPMILRPGYINLDMLKACIPEVTVDPGLSRPDSAVRPKAPGMKYRHYAPRAPLTIIEGNQEDVIRLINQLSRQAETEGKKAGILADQEHISAYTSGLVLSAGSRQEEETIAHNLYELLRTFDEAGVDVIYSEAFYTPRIGQAIMNRLLKAAGHSVLQAGEMLF